VRGAFTASSAPYAEGAFAYVERALDRYAEEWTSARVASCEATRVPHEQAEPVFALRTACLDLRADELRTLVDVFEHADLRAVDVSAEAVDALTSVRTCSDVAALEARVKSPDAAIAPRVEALRAEVARQKGLAYAGRDAEARADLDRLVADVAATGYRPLLAEALLQRAFAEARRVEDDRAVATLLEAVGHAEASREDEVAALGWARLVREHLMAAADVDGAKAALARARAAVDRLDGRTPARNVLLTNEAFLLLSVGELSKAAELEGRLIADLDTRPGESDAERMQVLLDLGRVLRFAGDAAGAREANRRELAIARRAFGEEHPRATLAMSELGLDAVDLGDLAEAESLLSTSLADQAYGKDDTHAVWGLLGLGQVYEKTGRAEEGLALARRAAGIEVRRFGESHPAVAYSQLRLAEALLRQRRYDEGLAVAKRVAALWEMFRGSGQFELARARTSVGEAELALGHVAEAKAALEAACAYWAAHEGPSDLRTRAASLLLSAKGR
jgi:tetratricopeptide (TPR) repeat protein